MPNPIAARQNISFKATSSAPSFNKTQVGNAVIPLPYQVTQKLNNSVGIVPSVRLNGDPAYVLTQSSQPSCEGDGKGKLLGVKSQTFGGEVKPILGSTTVNMGKHPIIRDGDPCTMQGGNTLGTYSTEAKASLLPPNLAGNAPTSTQPATPAEKGFFDQAADALKNAGQFYKDNISAPLHGFAGDAMNTGGNIAAVGGTAAAVGGGMVLTGIGAAPGVVITTAGGATAAVGGGVGVVGGIAETAATGLDAAAGFLVSGQLPNATALLTAYAQRMIMAKIDRMTSFIPGKRKKPSTKTDNQPEAKKPKEDKPQGGNGSGTNGTTILGAGGPCIVGPYSKIKNKCGEGQQAHHIIPDTLNRTSNRSQGAKGIGRIPGMPHLPDGPSICLSGQAKVDGTEHNEAHKGDVEIRTAALRTDNGPVGTIPVNEAVPIAMQSAINARPECKVQIEEVVRKAYPNYEKDNRSMNGAGKPATGETKLHLDDGKTSRDGNIMNTTKKRGRGG